MTIFEKLDLELMDRFEKNTINLFKHMNNDAATVHMRRPALLAKRVSYSTPVRSRGSTMLSLMCHTS